MKTSVTLKKDEMNMFSKRTKSFGHQNDHKRNIMPPLRGSDGFDF